MTARMNGAPWTAAVVAIGGYSSGILAFGGGTTAGNPTYQLFFVIGPLTGPGTYPFTRTGPTQLSVQSASQSQVWDSQIGGTGSVVVTDLTTARIKASLTATLPPAGGIGPTLTIDNASFNVGLP